ncbi:hypothetical protein DSO57_1034518 [Entomophthora muscae]|uniref:Uncharacterized protein n=1 Tax=Entomophthora muscae TaxID=34485 RepID=A0ACC2REN7_9FUNG|nr:hypothetical protein DSO57_1034518 [Entomophthora muscae]
MNEVHSGFIGASDLNAPSPISVQSFHFQPSPLQAMQLGMGQSIEGFPMDPAKKTAWKDKCLWLEHGVWKLDGTFNHEYFKNDPATGAKADFLKDFWFPYVRKFADAIHAVWKEAFIFIQPPFLMGTPNLADIGVQDIPNAAFTPHWYDIDMMIKRERSMTCVDFLGILQGKYKSQDDPCAVRVGRDSFRELCKEQIQEIVDQGVKVFGRIPCIFTEFGTMFDLKDGTSFLSGDYSQQVEGLDAYISAMDSVGAGFTLWNYTPENSHSEGDNWNCEDLSVYTQNHKDVPDATSNRLHLTSLDRGGRAISAFVRPYAKLIPGVLSFQKFDLSSCSYHLRFQLEASLSKQCEIFLPTHHYHPGLPLLVQVSHGSWSLQLFPILSDGIAISPLSDAQPATDPHLQYLIWDIPGDTPLYTHVTIKVTPSTLA